MDVLNRRDLRDEPFRGLLFSIVTYTSVPAHIPPLLLDVLRTDLDQNLSVAFEHDVKRICAGTTITLDGALSTVEPYHTYTTISPTKLDHRGVDRAVSCLSSQSQMIGLNCSDILSSQATNKQELTSALFSDAQRGIYALRLHARDLPEGSSAIDIELGRRIFWHLYTTDKCVVSTFTDSPEGY